MRIGTRPVGTLAVAVLCSASVMLPTAALADGTGTAATVAALAGTGDLSGVVSTGMPDVDSASVTTAAGTTVDIPKDPSDGLSIQTPSGTTIGLGIPNDGSAKDAVRTQSGSVVFSDPATSSSTAAQALTDGSARLNITIADAQAPHEYSVPVALPANSSAVVLEDGALAFADSTGSVVGGLSAPLARDAAGNPLRTYFTTNGINVTQHIDFDSSTAFPIVADHWYQPWKWGVWKNKGVRGCIVWGAGGAIAGSRGGPWGAGLGAAGGCFAGSVSAYWH